MNEYTADKIIKFMEGENFVELVEYLTEELEEEVIIFKNFDELLEYEVENSVNINQVYVVSSGGQLMSNKILASQDDITEW